MEKSTYQYVRKSNESSQKDADNWILQRSAVRQLPAKTLTPQTQSPAGDRSGLKLDLTQIPVSNYSAMPVQAKLEIRPAGDKYELEADRVAKQVVQQLHQSQSGKLQQRQTLQGEGNQEVEEELQRKPRLQLKGDREGMSATPELESSIARSRGSGQPLSEGIREPMEKAFGGVDFSGVKVHTDGQSDQLNHSMQAKAFTTGQDIFFRQGAYDPGSQGGQELLAHELTHVVQQNGGVVQGVLQHKKEEQEKSTNLRLHLQNVPTIQRYTEIKKGSKEYPAKKKRKFLFQDKDGTEDERFFTSQTEVDESFLSNERDEKGTYLPNLVHRSEADLKISDNCDLAIEDTSDEPKNFFATKALVDSANELLKRQGGKVTFKRTNRYLLVVSGSKEKKLYQVEPYVSTGKSPSVQGTNVRTPQRCNEMADFVSGKPGVEADATTKVNVVLADVLDKITDGRHKYAEQLTTVMKICAKDMSAVGEYEKLVSELSLEFRKFMGDPSTKDKMDGLLQEANVNEYMNPDLGNAIVTISATTTEEAASRDKENTFMYHFGTVVAKSGSDYITMENYARREEKNKNKLSGGDPLFFFRMYGTKKEAITWHRENLKTGAFIGAVLSFVVS
ncbi:hypothetical protein BJP34_16875 [Moorena producens PAL-8-15-08-1]|uniref:eCIS core domain-containing protein n=1 Tax=Moorena producens PAL-8-15-08-1 TaxID=1458985 RepID=A0A1D8TTJ9_9CYAN|nr:DUF4157 domain-containing protein [Moorena producens]AOX00895.1 hypothetical protein BJP34_16875 [Moorena producens PAL-8-15-08-1]